MGSQLIRLHSRPYNRAGSEVTIRTAGSAIAACFARFVDCPASMRVPYDESASTGTIYAYCRERPIHLSFGVDPREDRAQ
jgi:hypothetical protein